MTKRKEMFKRGSERGIALLAAVFALLLLSVIGLSMMYSTNMETNINSNYRDKQAATYAAMAGLQEARDRIRPYDITLGTPDGRIPSPAGLPTLGSPNVVYIINPKTGEDIKPWDPNNRYRDTELCHENILGLSGTPGVPCGPSDLPSVSTWYTVYDDSDALSSQNIWNQANPLDFKWVRIQLKANNNTPVAANGVSSDTQQVCWEGERQLLLPVGYGANCMQYGSVVMIPVTSPGSGYISQPTVTVAPPPGPGITATATANLVPSNDAVDQIDPNTPPSSYGTGYTSVPTVTIDPPVSGTQATAHVCVALLECADPYIPPGAAVASVVVTDQGTKCYPTSSPPAVLFSGGGGTGAAATAALQSGPTSCIAAWSVTGVCNARRNQTLTNVGLSGGGGSGFVGTLKFDSSGNVVPGYPTIESSGSGYASNPTGMTGFTGCGSLSPVVTLGKRIAFPQTITVSSGGGGYTPIPGPTVGFSLGSGSSGTEAQGTAILGPEPSDARKIRHIIVDNGGSGYDPASPPNVTITRAVSDVTGAGAGFHSVVGAGGTSKVGSITVDNKGSGYINEPAVNIAGGGGTGAQGRSVLGGGANWGKIFLLTALAETKSGARTMLQAEVTTQITGFSKVGAFTIDGPNPTMQNMPNSQPLDIVGNDANSCGGTADLPQPGIGGYEVPGANPATHSVDDIIDALPDNRLDHVIGEGSPPYPSVKNVYSSLGELARTDGLKRLMENIQSVQTNTGTSVDYGTPTAWAYNYIDGDATLNGGTDGYGVLAVTGKLTMNGNFHWHGVILIIGDGVMDFGGGGNGIIQGTIFVAKIWPSPTQHAVSDLLPSPGSPTINWNGGGGNSIIYDHCWVDPVMSFVPSTNYLFLDPLRVLSLRNLPY
jgi:hypothetical protein